MKKQININYVFWGRGLQNNFFENLLNKDFKIILSENPDYIFFSLPSSRDLPGIRKSLSKIAFLKKRMANIRQKITLMPFFGRFFYDSIYDSPKMPVLEKKYMRIFYTLENSRPDMNNCDWAFSFDYDEELKNPHHLRIPYYKFEGAGKNLIKKKINFKKIKKEKTGFCAFVYSNNSPLRIKFFKMLSKYKKVDSPGDSMNNMTSFIERRDGQRFLPDPSRGNWQEKKIEFLKKYKFAIAFENSSYPGYTTEKIYHPMLANAIPIYWGNPLIERDFNTKSFISYPDFEKETKRKIPKFLLKIPLLKYFINLLIIEPITIKKMIKRIIEIDNDDSLYEKYLNEPWYPDNKLTRYVDDKLIERQLKEIFG